MLNSQMLFYVLLYLLGLAIGVGSPADSMKESLSTLGAITLTALVASLLVPFAGFAQNERIQRFIMQYGIVPLFGLYTVVLYRGSSVAGLGLFVFASSVHFAYWTSGIHSRAYRLEQFKLGFADKMPKTAQLIATLNARGMSHKADQVISSLMRGQKVNLQPINEIFPNNAGTVTEVRTEIEGFSAYS